MSQQMKDINNDDPAIRSMSIANVCNHLASVNDMSRRKWMDYFDTVELCQYGLKDENGIMGRSGYKSEGINMLHRRIDELSKGTSVPESVPDDPTHVNKVSRPLVSTQKINSSAPVALQKVTTEVGVFRSLNSLKNAMMSAYPLIDDQSMEGILKKSKLALSIHDDVDFLGEPLYTRLIVKIKSACEDSFILSMGGSPDLLDDEPEEVGEEDQKQVFNRSGKSKPFIVEIMSVGEGITLPDEEDLSFETYKEALSLQKSLNKLQGVKAKARRIK